MRESESVAKTPVSAQRPISGSKRLSRLIAAGLLLLLAWGSCAGCGSNSDHGGDSGDGAGREATPVPFTLDVAAAAERLHSELSYRDQLAALEPVVMYSLLGVDAADVSAQSNYFSSVATAEEIIVFAATDVAAAARLKQALETRLQNQKTEYASYDPEEVKYLDEAVLETRDNYLVFCVAADGAAAARLITTVLAGE